MSTDKSMKVTDRRMFTPDGELREEYRYLESATPAAAEPAPVPEPEPPAPEPEPEPEPPDPNMPGFSDLVSLLGEHASIYLRQSTLPGPEQEQHAELAKLHIDLLTVLKEKTEGNLTMQESSLLEDVIYQLKMAFAGQRGF